ncbi:MAG: hypothetical protein HW387_819 [Parachlamydiales bacterium]|nr:hypothetical protein [Parachlamydiales bacterium]
MNKLVESATVGLVVYVGQKALDFLSKQPNKSSDPRLNRIRQAMLTCRNLVKENVSDKTWFVLTNVLLDNAWIASTILTYLVNKGELSRPEQKINAVTAFAAFTAAAWLVRFAAAKAFLASRNYLGTRNVG